jgi:hypothetical protein
MSVMTWAALHQDGEEIRALKLRVLVLEEQLNELTKALQNYLKVTLK